MQWVVCLNLLEFLSSENRRAIVKALIRQDKREWSFPEFEKEVDLSHATVWRTVRALEKYNVVGIRKAGNKILLFRLKQTLATEQAEKLVTDQNILADVVL